MLRIFTIVALLWNSYRRRGESKCDTDSIKTIRVDRPDRRNDTPARSGELTDYQFLYADYQFHRLLAECSRNPSLVTLLDQVFDKMILVRLRTMEYNPGVLEIRSEHRRIYQAVTNKSSQPQRKQ